MLEWLSYILYHLMIRPILTGRGYAHHSELRVTTADNRIEKGQCTLREGTWRNSHDRQLDHAPHSTLFVLFLVRLHHSFPAWKPVSYPNSVSHCTRSDIHTTALAQHEVLIGLNDDLLCNHAWQKSMHSSKFSSFLFWGTVARRQLHNGAVDVFTSTPAFGTA